MDELAGGIRRVTLPLPTRPGHVHSYLLPGDEGWTVVDTGLGLPDARERWAGELEGLPGRVRRVVVTHFHPDHVGAARDLSELTGAPVLQGRVDYEQCALVWGGTDWAPVLVDWFRRHGVPEHVVSELIEQGSLYRPFIRYQPDPELLDPGDEIDGWRIVAAPGHADGQLMLLRDGILVAADHVLDPISPTVGLWPRSRPDPLADYVRALGAVVELGPTIALPGHGEPIRDPVGRARQLIAHHEQRLEATAATLGEEPLSGYDVSFPLFGEDLKPAARRFAVAETLSHLERLVAEGGARRIEADGGVTYTSTP
ncbi:MAG TPA: MBL fold metallo-hydrolase [Gaiella sp.]|jgi:glyoxylase-like metal-dependent hydrolase (beta-lactamase superfamily II)|nr:MBL fold metallo-hydrolase [Gaiella sp.]